MASAIETIIERIDRSGLMSSGDVRQFLGRLPAADMPAEPKQLAKCLITSGKLTAYQLKRVFAGKLKGLVLGNYVIRDELGSGGMGQVFLARHDRLKRNVALKILPPHIADSPQAVRRFQREIEAAGRLNHPNIVTAYDADQSGDIHFLVMEYVEGQDLQKVVAARGPLPIEEAVGYALETARALDYAHQTGVIHRDIKPSNLLLTPAGGVTLLDMGLARLTQTPEESSDEAPLTDTGRGMGTYAYMPPEQALDASSVDARCDIYSLGCTLFFLLTGQPPYGGNSIAKMILAHRQDPIPSLQSRRPGAPQSLDDVLQKMLAKNPQERHASMEQVIGDLEQTVHVPQQADSSQAKATAFPNVAKVDLAHTDTTADPQDHQETDAWIPEIRTTPTGDATDRPTTQRQRRPIDPRIWAAAVVGMILLLGLLAWGLSGRGDKSKTAEKNKTRTARKKTGRQPSPSLPPTKDPPSAVAKKKIRLKYHEGDYGFENNTYIPLFKTAGGYVTTSYDKDGKTVVPTIYLVKFDPPDPNQVYRLTAFGVLIGGDKGAKNPPLAETYPEGTTLTVRVFDDSLQPIYTAPTTDLSGKPSAIMLFATRQEESPTLIKGTFYAGVEVGITGQPPAVMIDNQIGNQYGRSFLYSDLYNTKAERLANLDEASQDFIMFVEIVPE